MESRDELRKELEDAIARLMPYAKGVSAKSYDFDATGKETKLDYARIMKIVTDAGYHGFVGIEYEGSRLTEPEGIIATKKLLDQAKAGLGPKVKSDASPKTSSALL